MALQQIFAPPAAQPNVDPASNLGLPQAPPQAQGATPAHYAALNGASVDDLIGQFGLHPVVASSIVQQMAPIRAMIQQRMQQHSPPAAPTVSIPSETPAVSAVPTVPPAPGLTPEQVRQNIAMMNAPGSSPSVSNALAGMSRPQAPNFTAPQLQGPVTAMPSIPVPQSPPTMRGLISPYGIAATAASLGGAPSGTASAPIAPVTSTPAETPAPGSFPSTAPTTSFNPNALPAGLPTNVPTTPPTLESAQEQVASHDNTLDFLRQAAPLVAAALIGRRSPIAGATALTEYQQQQQVAAAEKARADQQAFENNLKTNTEKDTADYHAQLVKWHDDELKHSVEDPKKRQDIISQRIKDLESLNTWQLQHDERARQLVVDGIMPSPATMPEFYNPDGTPKDKPPYQKQDTQRQAESTAIAQTHADTGKQSEFDRSYIQLMQQLGKTTDTAQQSQMIQAFMDQHKGPDGKPVAYIYKPGELVNGKPYPSYTDPKVTAEIKNIGASANYKDVESQLAPQKLQETKLHDRAMEGIGQQNANAHSDSVKNENDYRLWQEQHPKASDSDYRAEFGALNKQYGQLESLRSIEIDRMNDPTKSAAERQASASQVVDYDQQLERINGVLGDIQGKMNDYAAAQSGGKQTSTSTGISFDPTLSGTIGSKIAKQAQLAQQNGAPNKFANLCKRLVITTIRDAGYSQIADSIHDGSASDAMRKAMASKIGNAFSQSSTIAPGDILYTGRGQNGHVGIVGNDGKIYDNVGDRVHDVNSWVSQFRPTWQVRPSTAAASGTAQSASGGSNAPAFSPGGGTSKVPVPGSAPVNVTTRTPGAGSNPKIAEALQGISAITAELARRHAKK